jgi:hypothetical protein
MENFARWIRATADHPFTPERYRAELRGFADAMEGKYAPAPASTPAPEHDPEPEPPAAA